MFYSSDFIYLPCVLIYLCTFSFILLYITSIWWPFENQCKMKWLPSINKAFIIIIIIIIIGLHPSILIPCYWLRFLLPKIGLGFNGLCYHHFISYTPPCYSLGLCIYRLSMLVEVFTCGNGIAENHTIYENKIDKNFIYIQLYIEVIMHVLPPM